MKRSGTLRIRQVTDGVLALTAEGRAATLFVERCRRIAADEEACRKKAAADAAEQAEAKAAKAARRAAALLAIGEIEEGVTGWHGTCPRDRATAGRVREVVLEWTGRDRPEARYPSGPLVAAREAEIVVQNWLRRRLKASIRDVSSEKTFRDEEGPAFARYDLLEEPRGRRYDVKNTIAPRYARHVLRRERPGIGVTLIGVGRETGPLGPRYELLGALDANDLDEWDRILSDLDGVGVLVPASTTGDGARIRPSWTFGSHRHDALAPLDGPPDPIARLDALNAWGDVPRAFRLLSRSSRRTLDKPENDTDTLIARLANRLDELGVDRLELRHLYVLTLEDFRLRYREPSYDASVYERALLASGSAGSLAEWRTPGGTWDPCHYYRALVSGLRRLASHRASLPEIIRTIHVTPANTIIANYRHPGDRRGPPPVTLVAMCGRQTCESRTEPGRDPWLAYGDEGVKVVGGSGHLVCPACGSTGRRWE